MAELYGKATGCCRGKGGSMHLGDPAVGMLPAIAIVAGGNSVVSGLGLAMKLSGDDRVAVVLLRGGRHQRGRLPRGPELRRGAAAADRASPARTTSTAPRPRSPQVSLVQDVAAPRRRLRRPGAHRRRHGRARACGRRRAWPSRRRAAGEGPTLLEFKTYRFTGHSRSDARGYRTSDEEREWESRDPLTVLGAGPRRRRARPPRGRGQGGARRRGRVRAQLAVPRARRRVHRRLCLSSPPARGG